MPEKKAFRFGAVLTCSTDAVRWIELARRLEAEGFASLLVADHFTNPMACGPMIVAAANATTTLRVGSYVYDNDFRHPALLAKEAATIDVLSAGRMELGLGAGYQKLEYDAVGLPFDPPSVRMGRLEEAVAILRRLFRGETVDFAGAHYQLHGQIGLPCPVQQPLPILIGGGGPRMLRLAARTADIIGFAPRAARGGGLERGNFSAAAMDEKVALLDAAITAAGRTDGGPERSILLAGVRPSAEVIVAGDPLLHLMLPEHVTASPFTLIGAEGAMVDALHARRERWGLSYYVCYTHEVDQLIPIVRKLAA